MPTQMDRIHRELKILINDWGSKKGARLNLEFQAKQDGKKIAGSLKIKHSELKKQEETALRKLQQKFAQKDILFKKQVELYHKRQQMPKKKPRK